MRRRASAAAICGAIACWVFAPVAAIQSGTCRVTGRATSGTTPLPGVSIAAVAGDAIEAVTSTEVDGTYQLVLEPGAYRLSAELSGFSRGEQTVPLGGRLWAVPD